MMSDRSARRRPGSWGFLLPLLGLAVLIATLPTTPVADRPVPTNLQAGPGTAGLLIGLDPVSGTPIGMPEETFSAKALAPMLDRSAEGLVEEVLPGGAVRLDLQGRFMSASVARVDQDGVHTLCTEDPDAAQAFLNGEGPRPAKKPEKKWEVK
jgi:hypothetical protein